MITAQDIREKTFEKARIGGYDMPAVDDFLEELADEISAAQKENSVLKSKMKVLVDKIEEYRSNEEALNQAVISAQKLAIQIENDARTRAAAILADADQQAKAKIGSISEQADAELKRLSSAKEANAAFFDKAREALKQQLKQIDDICAGLVPEKKEEPAPAPEDAGIDAAVRSIDRSVSRMQAGGASLFDSTQPFSL